MDEYITKEAAIQPFEWGEADVIEDYGDGCNFGFSRGIIKSAINAIPAADVAPVVYARWITRTDKGIISMTHPYMCSRCWRVEMNKEPYCNCGAKMDGGDDRA
jgi:hypothetical protein